MRNLVSVSDMSLKWWESAYSRCCDIIERPGDYIDSCRGKIMASLFYEPSTRTSFSFQAAVLKLGGSFIGFSDPMGSSVSKGETLADTIKTVSGYCDTIVIRSPQEGAAGAAALYSDCPIVNAGDGGHYHPTQTLTDLTTIAQKRGGIKDLRVGLCGDLKHGRTVHSLVSALAMFEGISYSLISPKELSMPDYVLDEMRISCRDFTETERLDEAIPELDVLYMTRIQRERFLSAAEYRRLKNVYILTPGLLKPARKNLLIMHPLPRVGEITQDVDNDPRAVYFEQARYGMFIRMALLFELLNLPRKSPQLPENIAAGTKCENPACVTSS